MYLKSLAVFPLLMAAWPALAFDDMANREGWGVVPTTHDHATLVKRVRAAVKSNGLAVVTQAGPTKAAASRGIEIPGNVVIGAFNNRFAVRILGLSTSAMIEAPVRLYVTENKDETATVSYKLPSQVFAPYMEEGGDALAEAAADLDAVFSAIAEEASAR
jgi:uncharacterized protein (DUF302 family)